MNAATVSAHTLDAWAGLTKKWHQSCMDAEEGGHGKSWYRSDLEDELRPVLKERNDGQGKDDHIRAWFDKLSLMSLSVDLAFALDMDSTPGKGPKYFWRHDGQLPAGMLKHRSNIVRGMSPGMLNLVWKMASENYAAGELVDRLGDSALPCIVLARVAVYSRYNDKEERANILRVLSDIEAEVAERLQARGMKDVYDEIFTKLLPAHAVGTLTGPA